jgi:hypothetical protein
MYLIQTNYFACNSFVYLDLNAVLGAIEHDLSIFGNGLVPSGDLAENARTDRPSGARLVA